MQKFADFLQGPVARIWAVTIIVALVLTMIIIMVAIKNAENKAVNQALTNQCKVTNVTRTLDNISHLDDYNVDRFIAKRFLVPTKTTTPAQLAITKEAKPQVEKAVADKFWSSLSDCNTSNGRGEISVHSIAQQKPPWYVLSVANAVKDDPYGSINLPPAVDLK